MSASVRHSQSGSFANNNSNSFAASAANSNFNFASASNSASNSSSRHSSRNTFRAQSNASSGNQSSQRQSQQQGGAFKSQVEQAVVNAREPVQTNETEQVTVGQYRGVFLNKAEVDAFRGPLPIAQYKINEDRNPEVIKKRLDKIRYQQEVQVRYLQPPNPPKPGDIIVREKTSGAPPAPPVIIRQEGCAVRDKEPLVFRERPPRPPTAIPEQVVEVEGCPAPPPPRRVIFEKLSSLPPKPQNIIVEKWLPYCQTQKRRVVFQPASSQAQQNVRNLVIEWEAPEAEVEKVCKVLGVFEADPEEYLRKYGNELKSTEELPKIECGCPPKSCQSKQGDVPELEGDVAVLKRVDLDKNGLGAYKRFVQ